MAVLDGATLNPGDLSWEPLAALGTLEVFDRTVGREEILARGADAGALFVNKVVLDAGLMSALPKLQYIGVTATGYNNVDLEAARSRGIAVTNAPGYAAESVAQHVFALILALCNQVFPHAQSTASGAWSRRDWSYTLQPIMGLSGKTLGIVGLGNIGSKVAAIGQAFGMKILAYGPRPKPRDGVTWTDLDTLFTESDILSLHAPLTPDNQGLVNARLLKAMKAEALLINTSRGGLIHESDLVQALHEGWIAGAGLDVLSQEPPPPTHPLLQAPRCLVTPHHAWATRTARQLLLNIVIDNFRAFLKGSPQNVVIETHT